MPLSQALRPTSRWNSTAHSVDEADALLARLWSSTDARSALTTTTDTSAVRTGVMNLVVVAKGEERGLHAAATLETLSRNPSRTLFIIPRDPEGPATFSAHLAVFCAAQPRGDGTTACTELLRIDVGGAVVSHLSSVIAPLSLHDLPTLLWWDAPIDATSGDLHEMLRSIDRIIIDGSTQIGSGLETLRALSAATARTGTALSDFSLIRQGRWRDAVAMAFDEPAIAPFLNGLTAITVTYAGAASGRGPVNIVKPMYHAAWLTSRLGATVETPLHVEPDGWGARIRVKGSARTIPIHLQAVSSERLPGTTLSLRIAAERRDEQLDLEVRADGGAIYMRAHVNGTLVRERSLRAVRATEASLLSHSLEVGEVDPLSPAMLRAALELIG